jgi:predicted MPP superfamily phosphohydrolase
VRTIDIKSSKIPDGFSGNIIVHLSDFHNKKIGNPKLIEAIKKVNPNIIVFTGDLIDSRLYNEEIAIGLLNEIRKIAPVYYVTGNHEWRSGKYSRLRKRIENCKVTIVDDKYYKINKGNDSIYIVGFDDPRKYSNEYKEYKQFEIKFKDVMNEIKDDKFKILLSHRPELFSLYSSQNIDLVFSGHAHGGQVRLPFIGGLFSPHQGLFPKYTDGIYKKENSILIVSRGLGNSSIAPQRLFNRPEIIIVKLKNN